MDIAAILAALNVLFTALKPLLPILAPVVIAALKKALPIWMEKIPSLYKPILSAVVGVIIAYLSGLVSGEVDVSALVTGAGLGVGGAKVRDLVVGKPEVNEVANG